MNIYDAAKVLGIAGDITPEIVKTAYRAACKRFHPDINPAGAEMMKVINEANEALAGFSGNITEEQPEYGELLNDALNAVLDLPNVIVEVMGSWIWLTGATRTHKDAIKAAGYFWSAKKESWYFRPTGFRSRSRGDTTLDEIREKYGSQRPSRRERAAIA
ncbi:MAG: J domain-containing protein [Gammaproteobacteria bacterium]